MLDELRELRLYTCNVDQLPEMSRRLLSFDKQREKSSPEGYRRALEVIARHCLFAEGDDPEQAAARAPLAINMLKDWCGFSAPTEDAPGLEGCHEWMKRFIHVRCAQDGALDEEKLWENWASHQGTFTQELFKAGRSNWHDSNIVYYQLTVARALRRGPLKRWCLVGTLDPASACQSFDFQKGNARKLYCKTAPAVITLTALCLRDLRQGEGVPQTGFVPVNLRELGAWRMRKEFERSVIEKWFFEDEPLFTQWEETAGVKKWQVSQAWLDAGSWQLIDITHSTEELERFRTAHAGEGFCCYQDAAYDQPDFEPDDWKTLTCAPLEQAQIVE